MDMIGHEAPSRHGPVRRRAFLGAAPCATCAALPRARGLRLVVAAARALGSAQACFRAERPIMPLRKKSLLDAFRNAPHGASPTRPVLEPTRANGTVKLAPASREGLPAAPSRQRSLLLGLLFLLCAATAGVWWWRLEKAPRVEAGGGDGRSAASVEAPAAQRPLVETPPPAKPVQGRGGTEHDRAFLDKENRVTVRVGQYGDDPRGRAEALSHYDYLAGEGMPCVMPVRSGKFLILCVGYAKKPDADLKALRDQVAALRGPRGAKKPPFATAWIDNIDNVVKR